jgi:hypothetical protein
MKYEIYRARKSTHEAAQLHQPIWGYGCGLVTCANAQELPPMEITRPSNATLPQIEMARVKPADRMTSNARLSDGVISLMNDFSLSSVHGIGSAWGSPLRPSTAFEERFGQW